MINNLSKVLKDNPIVMVLFSDKKSYDKTINILKEVIKQNKSICYVSTIKPKKTLVNWLNNNNIDSEKFFIIDCVPEKNKTIKLKDVKNTVERAINANDIVFFDLISTFTMYTDNISIIKFAHYIIAKIRQLNKKAVFTVLDKGANDTLINDLYMFIDEVIKIRGDL